MTPTPRALFVRVQLAEPLTIDVYGADGSQLRVVGTVDSAPDRHTGHPGDVADRLVLRNARAQVIDLEQRDERL